MKKIYLFLVLCCMTLAAFGQTTVTIYSETGANKTGSAVGFTASSVRLDDSLIVRDSRSTAALTNNRATGYAVFDLSSIPAGSTISGVTCGYYLAVYTAGSALSNTFFVSGIPGDISTLSDFHMLQNALMTPGRGTPTYGVAASNDAMIPFLIGASGSNLFGTAVGNVNLTLNRNLSWFGTYAGGRVTVVLSERDTTNAHTRRYAIVGRTGNNTSTSTANHRPFLTITYTAPSSCSGSPTAGTAVALPEAGNSTTFHLLKLSGASSTANLTYQWQSSSTETGTYSNISGATNRTYSFTGIASQTYYRCAVTCSSSTTYSNPTRISVINSYTCSPPTYSIAYYANYVVNAAYPGGMTITPLRIVGDSNTALLDSTEPGNRSYNNMAGALQMQGVKFYKSFTHKVVLRSGYYGQYYAVYMDYNNNGTFESTEFLGSSTAMATSNALMMDSITLSATPSTLTTGYYRLRFISSYFGTGISGTSIPPCSGTGSTLSYGQTIDYLVKVTDPPPAGVASPTSLAFGLVTTGTSSSSLSSSFSGSFLSPTSGSMTVTAPSNFQVSPDGSTWASSYTFSYTSATASQTVYVRFNPSAVTSYSGNVTISGGGLSSATTIAVTGTGAAPCSGTPSGGTAGASPTTGYSSTTFTLTRSGGTTAGGLTYQWKSSSTGAFGSFTNISGATNFTYSFSGLTDNTYYQCDVTCPTYGTDTTTTVLITWQLPPSSCSPTTTNASLACSSYQMVFLKVRMAGELGTWLGDSASCSTTGYQDRTALSTTLYKSYTYTANITTGTSYNINCQWWIDFNSDGIFQTTEAVGGTSAGFTSAAGVVSIAIPTTAPSGVFRMRGFSSYYPGSCSATYPCYPGTPFNPCGGHAYGEARDYKVKIMNPPPYGTVSTASLNFGTIAVSSTSSTLSSNVAGFFLTPSSGVYTVSVSSPYQVSATGSSWSTSYTTAYTGSGFSSTPVYVRFQPSSVGTYNDTVRVSGGGLATALKIAVTGSGATPCTGTPTAGTTVCTPTSGTSATTFVMSLSGSSTFLGLTYQWEYSNSGAAGTFTPIALATNSTYSISGLTTARYFHCVVACSYSGLDATSTDAGVLVYCQPAPVNAASTCTTGYYGRVSSFTVNGYSGSITDAAACNSTGYLDRTSLSCTLRAGNTYTATQGTTASYIVYDQIWIDFNDDGSFQTSESVGGSAASLYTNIYPVITIPTASATGTHRMRLVSDYQYDYHVYPSIDPCMTSYNYGEARDYTVIIAPPPPQASASPTSVAFGSVTTGTTSSALTTALTGLYLVPSSGSMTVTSGSSTFEVSPDGSTWSTSYTFSYTSGTVSAVPIYVRFSPSASTAYSTNITVSGGGLSTSLTIPVTGTGAALCTGTPTAGTASCSPTSGPTATSFTHSLTGTTAAGGLTYQWYSSTSRTGTFSAISGATGPTYTISGLTSNMYYYCTVTCTNSGLSSNSTTDSSIWTVPASSCTPTTIYGGCVYGYDFTRIQINGAAGTSFNDAAACATSGYTDNTSSTTLRCTFYKSYSYTVNMYSSGASSLTSQWWIDFNNDGTFQSTETVGGNTSGWSATGTCTITIPSTVSSGTYRMRGYSSYNYGYCSTYYPCSPNFNPCGGFYYGGARDYTVVITDPPPYATPSPSSVSFGATATTACSSASAFALTGAYLIPASGSLTVTAPSNYQVFNGSTWASSYTIGYSSSTLSSTSVLIRFCPSAVATYTDSFMVTGGGITPTRVNVTGYGAVACTGTPTGGTTTTNVTGGTSATTFTLGLSGTSTGLGLTYQWMSSTTGTGGWTNITGATNATYSFSGLSSTMYYYCKVSCSYSGLFSYSSVQRLMVYCSPSFTYPGPSCTTYNMTVKINRLNGASGTVLADSTATCSGSGYDTSYSKTCTLSRGTAYNTTLSTGPTYGVSVQMWIDFDDDGTFASTESVGGVSSFTNTTVTSVTIPAGATTGAHMFRCVANYSGSTYPSINPCGAGYYGNVRDYTVTIAPPPPSVTPTPTAIAFGGVLPTTTSATQTFSMTGADLLPTSGSLTVTAPSNYQVSPDGSTWSSSYTVGYTGGVLSATTVYARFTPPAVASYTGNIAITGGSLSTAVNVAVSGNGAGACSGTPTAGTAVATPSSGSAGTSFVLSTTGTTVASGLTYQWASSTTGAAGSFTNISGATTGVYGFTGVTADMYYKCFIGCPTYSTDSTSVATITFTLPSASCTGSTTYTGACASYGMVFSKVRIPGGLGTWLGDSAACSTSGYSDRTVCAVTLYRGFTYTANLTIQGGYQITDQWWIDFNSDGTFQSTEAVGGHTSGFATSGTTTLTIPSGVAAGRYRMRVWTAYNYGTCAAPNYPCYPNLNPCGGHNYGHATDYTVNIMQSPPTLSTTPTSLTLGLAVTGSPSPAQTFTMTGSYLLPTSGSVTVTAPSNFEVSPDGSTWSTSYTVGYTSGTLASTAVYVRGTPPTATTYSGNVAITGGGLSAAVNVAVDVTGAGPCSAAPTAGTASISPTTGSVSTAFSLSLSGSTVAGGLTYQWASSPTGAAGSFTNISAGTTATYNFTGISATTYYKCFVTCPSYGTDSSTVTYATYVIPASSCTPTTTNAALACSTYGMVFSKIRLTGGGGTWLGDSATCSTSGYQDRTSLSVTLYKGFSYTANVTEQASTYNITDQWWIDFNSDGTFQSTEAVGGHTSGFIGSTTTTIAIPGTVSTGLYRMRVFTSYATGACSSTYPCYPNFNPCGGHYYGEARDYSVNITDPPPSATATPTSLNFAAVVVSTTSAPQTFSLTGSYLLPTSGSLTITAPTAYEVSPDGSTWATSYTTSYTSATYSGTVYVRFTPTSATTFSGNVAITGGGLSTALNVAVTGTGAGACSALPTAGTAAVSPTSGSTAVTFTLSLTGTTVAGGLSYQWKSSSTGAAGSFTNIAGATTASYMFSGLTANTYYKCFVGCPAFSSNTDSTAAVLATYTLPASSCTPNTTYNACTYAGMAFSKLKLTGPLGWLGDSAACSTTAGYQDRTSLSVTLYKSNSYTMNMTYNGSSYSVATQFWIDFNNNGTFESTETVTGATTGSTGTGTNTLTIPSTVASGTYRMRGYTSYQGAACSGSTYPCSPNMNPCGGHYYGEARDYTVIIQTPPPQLTATPSSQAFGGVLVSSTSGTLSSSLSSLYLVPASGSLTVTAPTAYEVSPDGSTWSTSYTVGYTSGTYTGTVYIRFTPTSATTFSGNVNISGGSLSPSVNIAVTGTGAGACAATPTPGTAAVTPTTGSTGTSFTLSLSGTTLASGLTYQWQSASSGAGTYSNITGATNATYGFTGITANTYYKCVVTCPSYAAATSNTVVATYVLPTSSCTPSTTYVGCLYAGMAFSKLTMTGPLGWLGDSAACSTTLTYQDRTALSVTLYRANSYTMNMTYNGSTYSVATQFWIDFNNNGTFESTETVTGATTGSTGTGSVTITIPSGVSNGTYRMRGYTSYQGASCSAPNYPCSPNMNPCGGHLYGEARDYTVNIQTAPPVLTATPSSQAFGGVLVSSTSGSVSSAISGTFLVPTSGSLTVTAPTAYEVSPDGSTWSTSYTVGYTGGAYTGTVYIRFTPTSATTFSGNVSVSGGGASVNIAVSGTGAGACTGTPSSAGTAAITPTTGSTGTSFTATLSGTTPIASGYTYQWQSASSGGGTYSNISGATNATYGFTGISATTYYQCVVTCPSYAAATSNTVVATYVLPTSSCTPSTTYVGCSYSGMAFSKVKVTGPLGWLGDSAACSTTLRYQDRTSLGVTLYKANSYTMNMTYNGTTYSVATQWWIDFNNDGTFQTTETVSGTTAGSSGTGTVTLTIPSTVPSGTFRMRGYTSYQGAACSAPNYPCSPNMNPCGGHLYGEARDYTVTIQAPPPAVVATPTTLAFGPVSTGTSSASQITVLDGSFLLPASGSMTVTAPSNFEVSPDGSTWSSSYTFAYTGSSFSGVNAYVRFNPSAATSYSGNVAITGGGLSSAVNVAVSGSGATPCSGTPTAGTAVVTPSTATTTTPMTLSLTGATSAGGLTYQWQQSDYGSAGSFSNIAGATTIAYSFTGIPYNKYYQCIVTCTSSGGSATSSVATAYFYLPTASCTPAPTTASTYCPSSQMSFLSMNLNGYIGSINDALACNSTGYRDRTSLYCALLAGNSYSISYTSGTTYAMSTQWWIDFNSDGTFQSSESVGGNSAVVSGGTASISIPGSVAAGIYRMRGIMSYSSPLYPSMSPCATGHTYGEGRDYMVIVVVPSVCSGTPVAGATNGSATTGCSPLTSSLIFTGSAGVLGLTYQWQSSTTGAGGSYSNIAGATTSGYTAVATANTYYRCQITCASSGGYDTSTALLITPTPSPSAIGGASYVCVSSSTTLTNSLSGGTWSSSATGIATIHPTSGLVTGVSAGSCTISYTAGGCTPVTMSFSVRSAPGSISGATSLCVGGFSNLTCSPSGGTWSSSNSAIATVNSSSGRTTAVSAGSATITYSTGCGTDATTTWTSNPTPTAITGPTSICTLSTGTFTDTVSGGTWSNSPTTVGTINSSTGVFTATSTSGTSTLTYTIGFCSVTGTATVGAFSPSPYILGTTTVCRNATSTLTDSTNGGAWSSSNTSIATINGATGVMTGVSSGTATITYSTGCGTDATVGVTVNGSTVTINAPTTCSQSTLSLSATVGAGTYTYAWSGPGGFSSTSATPTISTVATGRSGVYSLTATQAGCNNSTSKWVAVDSTPQVNVIASPASICSGANSSLGVTVNSPVAGDYALYAIPYAPYTLSGTTAGPSGVNANATVTLPFTFNFYGSNYSTMYISTNGYVNFGTASTSYSTATLPSSATSTPKAMIAPFWQYMNASSGSIYYVTQGSTPNRRFIIQYNGVSDYTGGGTNTAQIVLYETSNVIDMFVTQKTGTTYTTVCGIQNSTGTVATTVPNQNNSTYTITNTTAGSGWRFAMPSMTYAWTPATGLSSTTSATPTATAVTSTTTYSVTTVDTRSGCTAGNTSTATVTVLPVATVYTVTPDSGCSVGTSIGLNGSESGITYYLYRGATLVGTQTGTGTAISFGSYTTTGTYTVTSTTGAGCNLNMAGSAVIYSSPVAFTVTGGNGCTASGVTVGLSGSQTGVNYKLYRDGSTLVSTLSGTGSAISFGSQTTAGTYTVIGVGTAGGACQTTQSGSSVVSPSPATYSVTGGYTGCSGPGLTIGLSGSQSGISYQLMRGGSNVGSPVTGSGSAITFGSLSTPGVYKVMATSGASCQSLQADSAIIVASPAVTLGANPSVCQPISSTSLSYTGATGSPTTYNITWDSVSAATGFSDVSSASLSTSIPLTIPSSSHGVFGGIITVSNGTCASANYNFTLTVYEHPVAAITSAIVPCSGYSTTVTFTGTLGADIDLSVDGGSTETHTLTGGSYNYVIDSLVGTHTYHLINAHNPVCSDATVDTTLTLTATLMTWLGGTSGSETDWYTDANWACGFIPTVVDDAIIPGGLTYYPLVTMGSPLCRGLKVDSGATVEIQPSVTLAVKGTLDNSGTITGDGMLLMNSTSAQSINGHGGTVRHFDMDNASGTVMGSGADMTIIKDIVITNGTLSTGDSLVLYADDTSQARVKPMPATGHIAGETKVMQYIPGGRRAYRFYAHPFQSYISIGQLATGIDITGTGGSTNGFTTTGSNAPSVFRYDPLTANSSMPSDPGWHDFTSVLTTADSNRFHQYQGIRVFMRGSRGEGLSYTFGYTPSPTTITTSGVLNQGEQVVHMRKGTGANQDFNMIGNPYASPTDFGTVVYNGKVSGNVIGAGFYVWNPSLGTSGNYQTVPVYTTSATPFYLQPNMAVQVRAAHNNDSLVFNESDKGSAYTFSYFKGLPNFVSLSVYDAAYRPFDMVHIRFGDVATENEDNDYDAVKPLGPDFNFYSISADNRSLSIDGRPYAAGKVVPLGIKSNYNQEFIIRAESISVPAGGRVYLHDKYLNQYVAMQQGTEYRFSITKDAATQGEKRFELSMEPAIDATNSGLQVTMTPNPASNEVSISFTSKDAAQTDVRITDLTGMTVFSKNMGNSQNGKVVVPITNLAAGIYMVELTSGSQKVVQRLIKE